MLCPLNNMKSCNNKCAGLVCYNKHENYKFQKYDYDFACGLILKNFPPVNILKTKCDIDA